MSACHFVKKQRKKSPQDFSKLWAFRSHFWGCLAEARWIEKTNSWECCLLGVYLGFGSHTLQSGAFYGFYLDYFCEYKFFFFLNHRKCSCISTQFARIGQITPLRELCVPIDYLVVIQIGADENFQCVFPQKVFFARVFARIHSQQLVILGKCCLYGDTDMIMDKWIHYVCFIKINVWIMSNNI